MEVPLCHAECGLMCDGLLYIGTTVAERSAYCRVEKNSGTGEVEGDIHLTQQVCLALDTVIINNRQTPPKFDHSLHSADSCAMFAMKIGRSIYA